MERITQQTDNVKSVKISETLYDLFRLLAKKEGRKINYLLNRSLENYLKAKKAI